MGKGRKKRRRVGGFIDQDQDQDHCLFHWGFFLLLHAASVHVAALRRCGMELGSIISHHTTALGGAREVF